ncbi:MAG: flagellar filament capping protein FliD [Oscillospiraceae bacterium]|nr:flagellar filament capping protein FliD [Oscillospiraceae bacterium]
MAIQTPNALRMSGMNSGLDTDAIVKAMTASTKFRITQQQRKVLKLEAQQEAYREIITALTQFKDKYFNLTKMDSNIRSAALFSQFSASTVQSNGTAGLPPGISISTSSNSLAGNYNFELLAAASQTTVKASSLDSNTVIDFSAFSAPGTYAMSVTVGSKSHVISFEGGAANDVRDSMNKSLLEKFGATNTPGVGIVRVENDRIVSADRSAISSSNAVRLADEVPFGTSAAFETGSNSITLLIDGQSRTFSFQTLAKDYFDTHNIFERNADDTVKVGEDGKIVYAQLDRTAPDYNDRLAAQNAFKSVVDDMHRLEADKYYDDWKQVPGYTEGTWGDVEAMGSEQVKLIQQLAEHINHNNARREFNTAAQRAFGTAYKAYVDDLPDDIEPDDFDTWLEHTQNISFDQFYSGALADDANFKAAHDTYFGTDDKAGLRNIIIPTNPDEYEQYVKDMNQIMALTPENLAFRTVYNSENVQMDLEGVTVINKDLFALDIANNTASAADAFNKNSFLGLNNLSFDDGVKLTVAFDEHPTTGALLGVSVSATDEDDAVTGLGILYNTGSTNTFGFDERATSLNTVTTATTLGELGTKLTSFEFTINDVDFKFSAETTVREMLNDVNASMAGVIMTFSTLTNSFQLASKEYGSAETITFADKVSESDRAENPDVMGLFERFGFTGSSDTIDPSRVELGRNMEIMINNQIVETTSNSFTIDGTTITVASHVDTSQPIAFTTEIKRDYAPAIDTVKSFVEDYNKLLDLVYGYTTEKPNSKYHFLTDSDKEDYDLSDREIEQWEKLAKKGLLYNDSTINGMMSNFRTILYGSTATGSGERIGLFNIGITTSASWEERGKLVLNEEELKKAFERDPDSIMRLFTDLENGIMVQMDKAIDSYVKATGARVDKGILVQKAGVANGSSTLDNSIYDQIKRINSLISSLEIRYKQQEDRTWKLFTAMEKQMGAINSQTSYIDQMFQFGNQGRR